MSTILLQVRSVRKIRQLDAHPVSTASGKRQVGLLYPGFSEGVFSCSCLRNLLYYTSKALKTAK